MKRVQQIIYKFWNKCQNALPIKTGSRPYPQTSDLASQIFYLQSVKDFFIDAKWWSRILLSTFKNCFFFFVTNGHHQFRNF
jgi:hypothetical protein